MTARDDTRLNGRHPEFARMSLRPGIGQSAMHEVANEILNLNLEERMDDVPSSLRHGNRLLPLGRYLRRSLRTLVGRDPSAPQSTLDQTKADLQDLREAAFNNSRSFQKEIIKNGDQAVRNMEARQRIYKKAKPL